MSARRDAADHFLSGLDMKNEHISPLKNATYDEAAPKQPPTAPASFHDERDTRDSRIHKDEHRRRRTASITDYRDSYTDFYPPNTGFIDSYRSLPEEDGRRNDRGHRRKNGRERERERGRSRSPDWEIEWTHDRYRHRDEETPRHGEKSSHMLDRDRSIKPNEDRVEATKTSTDMLRAFRGAQNIMDLPEKEKRWAAQRLFDVKSHIHDQKPRQINTDKHARPVKTEIVQQLNQGWTHSLETLVQADHTKSDNLMNNATGKSYNELQTEVARLRLEATLTRANTAKLERQGNLLKAINQRRRSWLAECDNDIGRQNEVIRMAVGFPAADRFGRQWQQRNISHNSLLMNIKKSHRTQIDELTARTLQQMIELPGARFSSDSASTECLSALEEEKERIDKVMESHENVKKHGFEEDMQQMLTSKQPGPATTPAAKAERPRIW